jgi:hypothetical protein
MRRQPNEGRGRRHSVGGGDPLTHRVVGLGFGARLPKSQPHYAIATSRQVMSFADLAATTRTTADAAGDRSQVYVDARGRY